MILQLESKATLRYIDKKERVLRPSLTIYYILKNKPNSKKATPGTGCAHTF